MHKLLAIVTTYCPSGTTNEKKKLPPSHVRHVLSLCIHVPVIPQFVVPHFGTVSGETPMHNITAIAYMHKLLAIVTTYNLLGLPMKKNWHLHMWL